MLIENGISFLQVRIKRSIGAILSVLIKAKMTGCGGDEVIQSSFAGSPHLRPGAGMSVTAWLRSGFAAALLLAALPSGAAAQTISANTIYEGQTRTFTVTGIPNSWTGGVDAILGGNPATAERLAAQTCVAGLTDNYNTANFDICVNQIVWDSVNRVARIQVTAAKDTHAEGDDPFRLVVQDPTDRTNRTSSFPITITEHPATWEERRTHDDGKGDGFYCEGPMPTVDDVFPGRSYSDLTDAEKVEYVKATAVGQVFPPPNGLVVDWDRSGGYNADDTAKIKIRTSDNKKLCGGVLLDILVSSLHISEDGPIPEGGPMPIPLTHRFVTMAKGESEKEISFRLTSEKGPARVYFSVLGVKGGPTPVTAGTEGKTLHPATKVKRNVNCSSQCRSAFFQFRSTWVREDLTPTVNLTVRVDPAPTSNLTLEYTLSGTADRGADYTISGVTSNSGTVTVPANATSATIPVMILDDNIEDSGETIVVSLETSGGYRAIAPESVTLTIRNDDPPVVDNTLPAAHPVVKHADLVKTFYDRITARHVHGNSASGGWNKRFLKAMGHPEYVDYPQAAVTVADATRLWNHGGPGANTAWDGTVDAVTYAEQYFAGLTVVPPPTTEPEVTIEAGSSISEGGGASFTLKADPVPTAPLEVTVTVATEGDYGITTGERTVTIPTTGSYDLTLTTTNDETDESDGSVTVTVDAGEGYTIGSDSTGTIAIEDDDAPAMVLPAAHPVMKYAALVKRFYDRITDSHEHGDSASGGWNKRFLKAMGHPEYINYPQTAVTVADATQMWNHGGPGANTAWDGTVDAVTYAEQYFAGLTVVPPPTTEPEVTIEAGSGVSEGGGASFTLKADPAPAAPLQVGVTIGADGDFGITAGEQTVTIPTTGSYTLSLTTDNDGTDEPDGSVTVTVNAGTGYTVGAASTGTVAITDDDLPLPAVSVAAKAASITEGGDAVFTVTADRAPDANLSVTLTVSEASGSDFVAPTDEGSTTVTIDAGKTEATLTVTTDDDQTQESDGTVTATVTTGSGYQVAASPNDTASIAVTDNDAAGGALPVLSVESKSVQEGNKKVTLWATIDPLPSKADFPELYRTTRLKLRTIEGTAWDGVDYVGIPAYFGITEACNFHTTLAPNGKHGCRIDEVTILDDAHDDGGETFQLEVGFADSEPAPLRSLGAARGTITIENSDPIPAAYLSRFGRTVAEQAIEGIAQRFDAARTPGMEGTLAGQALRFDVPGSDPSSPAEVIHSVSPTDRLAEPFGGDSHLSPSTSQSYGMSSQELLLNSSFTLTGESDSAGGTLALWGRTSQQSFDGTERGDGTDIRLDGKVTTTLLGTDYANDDLLLGLALAHSTGDGDYGAMSDEGVDPCPDIDGVLCDDAIRAGDGTIESSLSALIPYASVSVSPRLKLWGAAGHGSGEVKVKIAEDDRVAEDESYSYSADTSWSMAAAGMRASVIEAPKEGSGGSLTLTSDYLWTQTSSDKTMDLAASKSKVTRLRFGLEGGYHMAMADGGSFVPKLQIGARHDGGDAETGFGIELGGGLSWQSPALGLQFELEGRTLVSHDDEDFENRGFAVSLAYDENAKSERGASFALRQHIGAPSSGGLDALFASEPLSKRSGNDAQRRVTLEGAYGLPALGGHYTASPYGQMSFGETSRDYTIGWRWTPVNEAQDLSFGFKAVRSESLNAETENRFGFEAVARW